MAGGLPELVSMLLAPAAPPAAQDPAAAVPALVPLAIHRPQVEALPAAPADPIDDLPPRPSPPPERTSYPTAQLRSLFQFDVAAYHDPDAPAFPGGVAEPRYTRTNLRRARIGMEGHLDPSLRYALSYDFGGAAGDDRRKFNAAWIGWRAAKGLELRAGLFAPPGGLEGGSANLLLTERAAPAAVLRSVLGADGRPALGTFLTGDNWSLSAVVSGDSPYAEAERGQRAAVARFSHKALQRGDMLIHVGTALTAVLRTRSTSIDPSAPGTLRLSERGEMRADAARLVDTERLLSHGALALTLEAAAQWRNLLLQGESISMFVDQAASGTGTAGFSGWYVQAGWGIIGERRRYSVASGSFVAPAPAQALNLSKGVWGALELGLRYSRLFLDHRRGPEASLAAPGAVRGGRQRVIAVGANWYLSEAVRLQAALQQIETDRLSPAGEQIGRALSVGSLRFQYSF